MAKRIYIVTEFDGTQEVAEYLVRASSKAQAIRHRAKGIFKAEAGSGNEVATMMQAGIPVEDAGDDSADLET